MTLLNQKIETTTNDSLKSKVRNYNKCMTLSNQKIETTTNDSLKSNDKNYNK